MKNAVCGFAAARASINYVGIAQLQDDFELFLPEVDSVLVRETMARY
jgi:hypothetical protein